jgi:hypothetical protein
MAFKSLNHSLGLAIALALLLSAWGTSALSTPSVCNEPERLAAAPFTNLPPHLAASLQSLPSLSISAAPDDLFSTNTGIYLHPTERGHSWERAATIEFHPSGTNLPGFRAACGLRIHGGMSRLPDESPKHSFSLRFKGRYGTGPLSFPLFAQPARFQNAPPPQNSETSTPPPAAAENAPIRFTELVLRSGGNDSWLFSEGKRRARATYIRDEWMRRSLGDLGHPASRGRFVHLYLNGIYWGVYNLCEVPGASEPNTASTVPPTSFDLLKANKVESGNSTIWDQLIAQANAGVSGKPQFQQLSAQIDIAELIDFLLLNFYAGNDDWDHTSNWYALRPRTPEGRFWLQVWDGESILSEPEANTLALDDDNSPQRLFHALGQNPEFRALFADRAKQLLNSGGPLSPSQSAARFQALAQTIAPALPAEAARWGGYRKDVHPYKTGPFESYTVESHWQPETNRLVQDYFPQRGRILLTQLRELGF